jgi:hypothetical protein
VELRDGRELPRVVIDRDRIEHLSQPIPMVMTATDVLFSVETIPVAQLQQEQHVDRPQGLASLAGQWPDDDDQARRFLEATLSS